MQLIVSGIYKQVANTPPNCVVSTYLKLHTSLAAVPRCDFIIHIVHSIQHATLQCCTEPLVKCTPHHRSQCTVRSTQQVFAVLCCAALQRIYMNGYLWPECEQSTILQNMTGYTALQRTATTANHLLYNCTGVGDNTYCDWFNAAAARIHDAMVAAGATAIMPMERGDIQTTLSQWQQPAGAPSAIEGWLLELCHRQGLSPTTGQPPVTANTEQIDIDTTDSSTIDLESLAVQIQHSTGVLSGISQQSLGVVIGAGRVMAPYNAVPSFGVAASGALHVADSKLDLQPKTQYCTNRIVGLGIVGFDTEITVSAVQLDQSPVVPNLSVLVYHPEHGLQQAVVVDVEGSSFEISADVVTAYGAGVFCSTSGGLIGIQLESNTMLESTNVACVSLFLEKLRARGSLTEALISELEQSTAKRRVLLPVTASVEYPAPAENSRTQNRKAGLKAGQGMTNEKTSKQNMQSATPQVLCLFCPLSSIYPWMV